MLFFVPVNAISLDLHKRPEFETLYAKWYVANAPPAIFLLQ